MRSARSSEITPASHLDRDFILICFDGIPHELMRTWHAEGLVPGMRSPSPLISTFPAITEVMLTSLFGVEPPPGYGLRYYDKSANSLRGGITQADAISVWFSLYDYVTPMIDRGMIYLWARCGASDIEKARRTLDRYDSGVLLMHMDSTDALMHHEKPEVTRDWVRDFGKMLGAWIERRRAIGREPEIVIFSDHGNDLTPCRRVPIEAHLRKAGFSPSSVIRGESGVAILPTGLISVSYMYTSREAEVARALCTLDGVDLALYETGGVVHVESPRGRARIDRSPDGERYRYVDLEGDPLRLADAVDALRRRGAMDEEGYAHDREWLAETLTRDYPDVLGRAWGGLTGHVANVADVLVSLDAGWHCGSRIIGTFFRFQGTHGSLQRRSVTGFAMSNRRELQPQRAEDLLDHLGYRAIIKENTTSKDVRIRER